MIIFKTASAAIWNRSESSSYIETHARPNPSQNSIANFSSWPKVESYEVGLIKSECRQFSLPRILAAMCNSIIWNGRRKTEWGNGARNQLQNLNSWMSRILKDANSDVFKKSNSRLIRITSTGWSGSSSVSAHALDSFSWSDESILFVWNVSVICQSRFGS